jgi:hypothetical protein
MSGVVVGTPHANASERNPMHGEATLAGRSHGNDTRVFQTDETDGGVAVRMSETLLIHLRHLRRLKKEGR